MMSLVPSVVRDCVIKIIFYDKIHTHEKHGVASQDNRRNDRKGA